MQGDYKSMPSLLDFLNPNKDNFKLVQVLRNLGQQSALVKQFQNHYFQVPHLLHCLLTNQNLIILSRLK